MLTRVLRRRWALTLCVGLAWHGSTAYGQTSPTAPPPSGVITTIRQFWNLTPEQKLKSHPFRIECDVTFYDPIWKNLWIQDVNEGTYVAVGDNKLAFKSGQHVVVSGTFEPPNYDLSFEHAIVESTSPSEVNAINGLGQSTRRDLLSSRVVVFEAFVVRQSHIDPEHLNFTLVIEGRTAVANAMVNPLVPLPDYTDSIVRIRGVYAGPIVSAGPNALLELRVASLDDITTLTWLGEDPRFKLPASPIASVANVPAKTLVRVTGSVVAQEPGRYLRIRDESGQIDLRTGQIRPCAIGERVEAIGYPAIESTEWTLTEALYRSLAAPLPLTRGATGSVLRVGAQVLELSPEEAAAGRPVLLSGVVTWSHPESPFIYVQDASGGVCVSLGTLKERVRAGRSIEVKGHTAMGGFAPIVLASELTRMGELVLPEARQVSLELALTGVEEAQWVEMRGYLRKVEHDGAWIHLELTTSAGNFRAELPASDNVMNLEGSIIRLHGVCTADADDRRKLTGIKLLVPSANLVQLEETAPKELFDQPARLLANLGQYGTLKSFNRRVKVSGTVLNHSPGHFINIVEGEESLMVLSRQITPLVPGDRIDAVGFLGRQASRPVLREAVYRQTSRGAPPEPRVLTDLAIIRSELDGRLVRAEATLIDDSSVSDQVRLTLQSTNTIFEAYLEHGAAARLVPLQLGSVLRLTGVYEIKYGEDGQAGAFLVRLRSPEDVVVLSRPSPLTRGRVLTFAGALAVAILLFVAWIVALHRRVQQQTTQIRDQLERESRLESELQRASKLESLGILAGGIAHDFNNLLTVVMGNLSLAMLDLRKEAESTSWLKEAERAVGRARDLTQQLLTFSKGGAPIRSAVLLPDVVREVAQFALCGSNVRCVFNFAPDLWPADVDKGQIGQVVQNIVINAMQVMPDGGQVEIALRNEMGDPGFGKVLARGRYVKLTMTDHGSGIAPENLNRIFEPYFTTKKTGNGLGLATVYSIVKKHLGHVTVESTVGQGTSFHIWLPASATAVMAARVDAEEHLGFSAAKGRVLFMDDDAEIRRCGAAMLERLGYDAKVVSNGDEAVVEYQNALERMKPYDVVILDLTVAGGMGGREAVEQLLRIDPQVRAIVSSGYSNDVVLANFRAHGFYGIVSKPYETAALALTLSQVLSGSHA
ncbi:MAG: ATP-binding protein [Opitutus sp.]